MWVISESITPVAIATPLSVFAVAWLKKDRKIAFKGLEIASAETQRTLEVLQTLLNEIRSQRFSSLRINK